MLIRCCTAGWGDKDTRNQKGVAQEAGLSEVSDKHIPEAIIDDYNSKIDESYSRSAAI